MVSQLMTGFNKFGLGGYESTSVRQDCVYLFLHGFPDNHRVWRPIQNELSESSLSIDLPGIGLSIKAANKVNSFDYVSIANLLNTVIETNIESSRQKIHLVAHDLSAFVAYAMVSFRSIYSSLTIINGPHPVVYKSLIDNDDIQRTIFRYAYLFAGPDGLQICKANNFQALKTNYFDQLWLDEHEKSDLVQFWKNETSLSNFLQYYRYNIEALRSDKPLALRSDTPLHLFWGENDHALITKNVAHLQQFGVEPKSIRLIQANHWSMREKMGEFLNYLRLTTQNKVSGFH